MSGNEETPLGGNREASTTRTGDTGMVTTVEGLTQRLRAKNNPPLNAYARIIAAQQAAQRVAVLATNAMNAYAHQSPEESIVSLRALDFATDRMSDHVEHALKLLADEVAS